MENLSTFVRTLGNQFIRGRKIFTGIIGLEGTVLDGNTSAGTSGQVLSTTGSGVQWITVGSSNVGELDDLTDVQVGTPSDGQLLRYDSESGLWYNWTPNYLDTTDGLNDLNGVVITSAVSNQFLKYNGTNWVNANVLLSDLGDTSISSPSADQILVYGQPLGGTPGVNVWYNKTHNFLTTATNIDDLNNVIISTQTAGDILRYNGTNWVNVPFSNLENDTLDSVTDRGNTTTNTINVGGVITDYVEFDTSVTLGGDESQGYMAWNSDVDTVSVYPYDSTWFNIGQDMHWHVKNGTAHTIERGQVVMATGAVGNSSKIEAGLMVADGTVSSKYILGVAIRDIASGEFGKVASQGIIRGIDTSTLTEGSVLWCDPDTDGGLTSTEPDAPNLRLPIAFVVSAGTNGAIAVRITTGNVLHELHDVDAPSPATGDLLRYSALTGIWENWTPTYISSFTETDPIFVASPAHGIASTDITNWNTAYGWGNHATAGYLTSLPAHNHDDRYYTETEVNTLLAGKAAVSHTHEIEDITGLADSLDLKLETESDTLNSVTGRGNTTSNTIFVGSARGSSGTYGTGIYGDNSGASVQFGTSAALDSLGIVGAYSSKFNINSKNGPLSFQYYGTEYMNISASGDLKLNSYGAGLLKTDANGNVTVDTNVYITADDQELTWEQSTKELSISDGNTVTLSGLASIEDVEGYGYITTEVDTLNTVTSRGAITSNAITTGDITISDAGRPRLNLYDSGNAGGGGASGVIAFSNTAGRAIAIGYTEDVTATSDLLITTNAGSTYGGYLDLDSGAVSDPSSIILDPKTNVLVTNGNVGIGTTSPAYKLDIDAGSDNIGAIIRSSDSVAQIAFRDSTTGGDANVRLGATGTDMTFFTGGAEKMRIDSNGNVGIGTTSPLAGLHINSSGVPQLLLDGGSDTTGDIVVPSGEILQIGHWNTSSSTYTDRLRITADGNVGIGTTSPTEKLQVAGNVKLTGSIMDIRFIESDTTDLNSLIRHQTGLLRFDTISDSEETITTRVALDHSNGNVGIGTTSPTEKLHVNGNIKVGGSVSVTNIVTNRVVKFNGSVLDDSLIYDNGTNVGIGTSSPSAKLHIAGGGDFRTLQLESSKPGVYFKDTGETEGYHFGQNGDRLWVLRDSDGDGAYNDILALWDSGAYRVYNNLIADGNVGIGTTSPAVKLDVDAGTSDTIAVFRSSDNRGRLQIEDNDTNIYVIAEGSKASFGLTSTLAATNLNVDSDGNVGIGTTSPTQKLTVEDTIGIKRADVDAVATIQQTGAGTEINAPSGYHPLIIKHNGTEFARFKNDGNVGIGTTSPSWKLQVEGPAKITQGLHSAIGVYTGAGTYTNHWQRVFTHQYSTFSYSAFKIIVQIVGETGNVNTNAEVHVTWKFQSNAGRINVNIVNYGENPLTAADFQVYRDGTNGYLTFYHRVNKNYSEPIYTVIGATDIFWRNDIIGTSLSGENNDGFTEKNIVEGFTSEADTGNFGIGTTSPSGKLHSYISATRQMGHNAVGGDLGVVSDNNSSPVLYVKGTGTADLVNVLDNTTNVFTIKDGGNVGIGTTSPNDLLQVGDTSGGNSSMSIASAGNSSSTLFFRRSTTYDAYIQVDNNEDLIIGYNSANLGDNLKIVSNTTNVATFDSSGNLGIGTTSPSYKLHVSGSFSCTTMNISEDITTSAGNVVLANDAGIYSLKTGTITAGNSSTAFRVSNTDDVQAARVTFVVESTNFQVAKIYEVVKAGTNDPVAFKVVDTGPSGEEDFSVAFSNDGGDLLCTVTNDSSAESMVVVSTIFLGGSISSQTVSAS